MASLSQSRPAEPRLYGASAPPPKPPPPLSRRGWPRPSRCGLSNHIRGSAGAVARVIFWLPRDHRGVCAGLPRHLPELGACGRAREPHLDWSEVSRSPQRPFLTHTPQPHALGVPPTDEVYITKHSKASENSNAQSRARELFTEALQKRQKIHCQTLEGFYCFLLYLEET